MDTGKECCGGSCACADENGIQETGEKLGTKVCCGGSAVCGSHEGHSSDDDGFGDYMGDDHDRVMRDRERSRVQLSLEKVRLNFSFFCQYFHC